MNNAVEIVENPEYLAGKINACHRAVVDSGKSMLAYAAKAGEHLLAVKGMLKHGEFKAWIERHCECSYVTATKYMNVARRSEGFDLETFEGGVDAFLGYSKPKTPEASPTLTREDAEYILKLNAVAERGGTENEQDVARRKLADFAGRFGMREDVAVDWATSKLPDHGKSADQIERDKAREELAASQAEAAALRAQLNAILARTQELETEVQKLSREELVARYIGLVLEREGLTELKKAA